MTSGDAWDAFAADAIEAEPIPASGLVIVKCQACLDADTLAVPHMIAAAVCEDCRRAGIPPRVSEEAAARARGNEMSVLNCFPEFVRDRLRDGVWTEHPAPEFVGPWTLPGAGLESLPAPQPVLSLAEFAREAGWEVEMRYARGNGVHGRTGEATALRHSIALRFGRHPLSRCEARAVYVKPASGGTWVWQSVWIWGATVPFFGWAGVTQLKEWLAAGAQVGEEWYRDVRRVAEEREAAGKARAKERAAEGKGRGKAKESGG